MIAGVRSAWSSMLVLTLACHGSGGGGQGDDEGPDTSLPSPYAESTEESGAEPPSLSPEQAAASAMAGLRTFVSLQPDAAIEAFEAMLVLEDGCPEDQEVFTEGDATVTLWSSEGCTTSTGLELRGQGRLERFTTVDGDVMGEGASLSSEGSTLRLSTADGRFIELSGGVYYERASSPEGQESYFEAGGQLSADPETAAAAPLLDPALRAQGGLYSFQGDGYKGLGGQGSLGAAALPDALAFQVTGLFVLPVECAKEPIGTVSVRDDAGHWHDIVFDAGTVVDDEDPVFDADACDGCGAYLVGGTLAGQACISEDDVAALVGWEGAPW